MTFDEYKQFLDIICDEVNVKCIGEWKSEKGKILYERKTRKFIIV